MSVQLYRGSLALVRRSGVGRAVEHQREMLHRAGVRTTDRAERKARVVHCNTVLPDSLLVVRRSGVGRAVEHQREMLHRAGVRTTDRAERKARVVHCNTVLPDSLLAAYAARLRGKRVVFYGHSTMEDFRSSFRGSDRLAPLFCRWIRLCYNSADVVITPTEYARDLLVKYGVRPPVYVLSNGVDTDYFAPSAARRRAFRARYGLGEGERAVLLLVKYGVRPPVYVLSNGVDTDYFAPSAARRRAFRARYGLGEGERAVLSVGHYIARKGLPEFVEMARSMPETRFFWFGYTPLKLVPEQIRQAVRSAPENVVFPGYVDREQLREAYCGCDVFAFLSHEETEGIVVLEALACGIPVVLREIPVYEGWLTDGLQVYKAADDAGLRERVEGLLSGALPPLREGGLALARARSMDATGARLRAIYQREGLPYEDPAPCPARQTPLPVQRMRGI